MIENIRFNEEKHTRRNVLIGLGSAAFLGFIGLNIGIDAYNVATATSEIKTIGDLPPDVATQYANDSALSFTDERIPLLDNTPTKTPDIWRATNISMWKNGKVSGGSLVEYKRNTYGIMTTKEALANISAGSTDIFIPGLEIEDVARDKAQHSHDLIPRNEDLVAFASKAFSRINTNQFHAEGNNQVILLALDTSLSEAVRRAKEEGNLQPLIFSQRQPKIGDRIGGARFDPKGGMDARYEITHQEGNILVATNTTDHDHFVANRLGDGVVFLDEAGDLTTELIGFTGNTLSSQVVENNAGHYVNTLATSLQVIR